MNSKAVLLETTAEPSASSQHLVVEIGPDANLKQRLREGGQLSASYQTEYEGDEEQHRLWVPAEAEYLPAGARVRVSVPMSALFAHGPVYRTKIVIGAHTPTPRPAMAGSTAVAANLKRPFPTSALLVTGPFNEPGHSTTSHSGLDFYAQTGSHLQAPGVGYVNKLFLSENEMEVKLQLRPAVSTAVTTTATAKTSSSMAFIRKKCGPLTINSDSDNAVATNCPTDFSAAEATAAGIRFAGPTPPSTSRWTVAHVTTPGRMTTLELIVDGRVVKYRHVHLEKTVAALKGGLCKDARFSAFNGAGVPRANWSALELTPTPVPADEAAVIFKRTATNRCVFTLGSIVGASGKAGTGSAHLHAEFKPSLTAAVQNPLEQYGSFEVDKSSLSFADGTPQVVKTSMRDSAGVNILVRRRKTPTLVKIPVTAEYKRPTAIGDTSACEDDKRPGKSRSCYTTGNLSFSSQPQLVSAEANTQIASSGLETDLGEVRVTPGSSAGSGTLTVHFSLQREWGSSSNVEISSRELQVNVLAPQFVTGCELQADGSGLVTVTGPADGKWRTITTIPAGPQPLTWFPDSAYWGAPGSTPNSCQPSASYAEMRCARADGGLGPAESGGWGYQWRCNALYAAFAAFSRIAPQCAAHGVNVAILFSNDKAEPLSAAPLTLACR